MSKKISQLPELTTVLAGDLLAVVNNGVTKKVTKANLLKDIAAINYVDGETPAGSVNGANTVFTTAFNFTAGSTHLYLNGLRLKPGTGNDYRETAANQITLSTAPQTGDALLIDYCK